MPRCKLAPCYRRITKTKWSWNCAEFRGIGVYMHATFLIVMGFIVLSHRSADSSSTRSKVLQTVTPTSSDWRDHGLFSNSRGRGGLLSRLSNIQRAVPLNPGASHV